MRRTPYPALALLACLALNPMVGTANPKQPENWLAQTQAATCTNCHRISAAPKTEQPSAIPPLYSLSAQQIEAAMLAFKNGQRPATVMHQLAKGYSDASIASISQVLGQTTSEPNAPPASSPNNSTTRALPKP